MRTNKIGKIAVGVDGHKQAYFDLSHDVETTMNMGEVQPLFVKEMKPHSKLSMRKEDLVMTAPFNVFTYGKMGYDTLSMYVDRHKIFPRLDSFLTGEPDSCPNDPTDKLSGVVSAPAVCGGILASYMLIGAKLNVWHSRNPIPADMNLEEELEAMHYNPNYNEGATYDTNFWRFETGTLEEWESSQVNIKSALWKALVRHDDTSDRKLLVVRNSGNFLTTPSLNPRTNAHYFNNGEKSHMWLNLSYLNELIQSNNYDFADSATKALYPEAWANYLRTVRSMSSDKNDIYVPLSNSLANAFGIYNDNASGKSWVDPQLGNRGDRDVLTPEVITPESADIMIPYHFTVNGARYLAVGCFKLSDAGKRFYSLLKGCEMPVDIGCSRMVNAERLLAYYMAYYESFGIQTTESAKNTPFARLINKMRIHINRLSIDGDPNVDDDYRVLSSMALCRDYPSTTGKFSGLNNTCVPFVLSLFETWLTDGNDFASIHTNTTAGLYDNSNGSVPKSVSALSEFISKPTFGYMNGKFIGGASVIDSALNPQVTNLGDGVVGANQDNMAIHTITDANLLLKMGKWTNRYIATGKDIEKQLKALGYGHALDLFGALFIGKTSNELEISQVPSLSDTYNEVTKEGKELGEVGAKSINYDKSQRFSYETDNGGYWVTMCYIRPVSGYSQSVDCEVFDCERSEVYVPEFDGLGMEYTPIAQFFNHTKFASVQGTVNDPSTATFGLVPRDSHRKVTRDVMNRGFALASTRSTYAPYHLNRFTPLGDVGNVILDRNGLADFSAWDIGTTKPMVLKDVPRCGLWTRMPYAYEWLCQLERIFSRSRVDNYEQVNDKPVLGYFGTNFHIFGDDNFIVHTHIDAHMNAPMKPIEVSYETYDPEKGANGAMSKA